ncbi:MAG: FtsX-like permease family protein, partial [Bacteroidetes bacterium]|nr:FtsX-like permease family protein [Bacteroidota bacterium]
FRITGIVKDPPDQSHFSFDFIASFDSHDAWFKTDWEMTNYYTYLLLKEGIKPGTLEQKFPEFVEKYMANSRFDSEVSLQPITDIHLHSNYHREFQENGDISRLYILGLVALFLLAIAGINFINLATARSAGRAKEVGIRKVIGARKKQLIAQFMGESILLCLIATMISLAIADLSLPWFNALTGKNLAISYLNHPGMLAVIFLGAMIMGILAGIYPAFFLSSFKPIEVLGGSSRSGKGKSFFRQSLVIFQFVISAVLIFATLVIFEQLSYISKKELGFDRNELLAIRIPDGSVRQELEILRSQWQQNGNIQTVGATSGLMGGGDWGMPLKYEGGGPEDRFAPRIFAVDPNYISAHKMEIVKGRDFSREISSDLKGAFIINESAAKKLDWENPVGKYLERPVARNEAGEWRYQRGAVVGVVKDFHYHSLKEKIEPMAMYIDSSQVSYLMVKISPNQVNETLRFIENTWDTKIPEFPIDYFFLDRIFDSMYSTENQLGEVIGVFAGLVVVIACLGLFGLIAFITEKRTKEIGIRKVLGASVQHLILLLSKDMGRLVGMALLLAAVPAWWIARQWLEQYAYRTDLKPSVFIYTILILIVLTALTLFYHVIRAASENPVNALRDE